MKKLLTLLALAITIIAAAQAPQGFNYQATVRNSSGALIINQNVTFKFNIMLNSSTSLPVFSETHYVPTDDLGQVNLTVGTGTPTTGTFAGINWANGSYFLGIELNTGTGFVAMGTTQLLSVPYALYANNAGSTAQSQGKTSIYLTGDITNAEAAARIAAELGPETENISIRSTTQLTAIDLSSMTSGVDITVENNEALNSINLNGLTQVYHRLSIGDNPNLTSISVNNLTESGSIGIYANNILTSLSFNSLQRVFSTEGVGTYPGFDILGNNDLQSVSLPILSKVVSISMSYNSLLSLDLPSLTKVSAGTINLFGNKLSSTSVNSILHKCLTVQSSNSLYIGLDGQTPPAPPTGQGIADKQTLINAGNSVATD